MNYWYIVINFLPLDKCTYAVTGMVLWLSWPLCSFNLAERSNYGEKRILKKFIKLQSSLFTARDSFSTWHAFFCEPQSRILKSCMKKIFTYTRLFNERQYFLKQTPGLAWPLQISVFSLIKDGALLLDDYVISSKSYQKPNKVPTFSYKL